jgi:hypothetical protein
MVPTGDLRDLDVLLDVLLGEHRRARGDLADDRQSSPIAHRLLRLVDEQLDRPRLARIAPQQPDLLEVRQMRMHRRRRGQSDRLADVAHRRRVAVLGRVALDEVEDLLLALRQVQVHGLRLPFSVGWLSSDPNTCS